MKSPSKFENYGLISFLCTYQKIGIPFLSIVLDKLLSNLKEDQGKIFLLSKKIVEFLLRNFFGFDPVKGFIANKKAILVNYKGYTKKGETYKI